MTKKETLEIRRQFTPANCCITRICGCYVDFEKNKMFESKDAFLSLPEDEAHKYFDIFKKTLSGTIGRNLLSMEFPLEQEAEGGTQEFLLRLRKSKLQDEALLDEFYNKIIENYYYAENYYIILIHMAYDVPGKSTDGSEMFDASDEVYDCILCSLCPVNLSKPGLCYNPESNHMEDRIRDWLVDVPMKGFLFPAFTDRSSDIHGMLYYSKNPEDLQPDFIDQVFGSFVPLSAGEQKESFQLMVEDVLGDDCDYDVVKNIHETLNEMVESNKENPEPLTLTKADVKSVFQQSGVPDENIKILEEKTYDNERAESTPESPIYLSNIANTKKFNIKTPDIVINVNPEKVDLIETRLIDGKQCLVITVDDHIEVNGVNVRTIKDLRGDVE